MTAISLDTYNTLNPNAECHVCGSALSVRDPQPYMVCDEHWDMEGQPIEAEPSAKLLIVGEKESIKMGQCEFVMDGKRCRTFHSKVLSIFCGEHDRSFGIADPITGEVTLYDEPEPEHEAFSEVDPLFTCMGDDCDNQVAEIRQVYCWTCDPTP